MQELTAMVGTLEFEILSHKVLNRIIDDHNARVNLQAKPPTDDDVDVLGSMLLHGHVGCYLPTAFFYASFKLLFPSFNLDAKVVRKIKKSRNHSEIEWQTMTAANTISAVCQDFHQVLFGEYPKCNQCSQRGSEFYEALSLRYKALNSDSSQKAREYLLRESLMLRKINLEAEASRALADYFRVLAEVEPSSYRCALYDFFAYALRKRDVFGCIAYAWDLFEYHKHLMCHYALLNDDASALRHADTAEKLAIEFNMKDELEEIKSISSLLRRNDNGRSSQRRLRKLHIDEGYTGELDDTMLYYMSLKTSDFRIKSQILHKISKNLLRHKEAEIGRYYSFLAEICDYIPLSKAHRRQDILRLKGIAAKYRFEDLAGAEIHKELVEVLLSLSEDPGSIKKSDLKEIEKKLKTINNQCKSLLNDELMSNVVETTSSIVSELKHYLSLSQSESIKIADVAYRLIRVYEERVPGLLKYMEYPELVELLCEGTAMFKPLLTDLASPIAAQRIQGKTSYIKGLSLEQDLYSAAVKGLWKKIAPLKQFETVFPRLRDREGTREKDLVLHLKSEKEEAIAIFTAKNHKRPCGIGLVDEFRTVVEEEKRLRGKDVFSSSTTVLNSSTRPI